MHIPKIQKELEGSLGSSLLQCDRDSLNIKLSHMRERCRVVTVSCKDPLQILLESEKPLGRDVGNLGSGLASVLECLTVAYK